MFEPNFSIFLAAVFVLVGIGLFETDRLLKRFESARQRVFAERPHRGESRPARREDDPPGGGFKDRAPLGAAKRDTPYGGGPAAANGAASGGRTGCGRLRWRFTSFTYGCARRMR